MSIAKYKILLWLALIPLAIISPSCEDPEKDNPSAYANRELFNLMHYWYLWPDQIPRGIRYANYTSPEELLDAMRYKELDRWSYVTTQQAHSDYFQYSGVVNFGIGIGFDQQGDLWILYLYNDSPLREHGVERGWKILSINNEKPTLENIYELLGDDVEGFSRSFVVQGPDGQSKEFNASKKRIVMNTVLKDSIYYNGSIPIGYIALQNFTQPTTDELDEVFDRFIDLGVQELIVDLRYNGGGRIDAARHMAGLIAGYRANGGVFSTYMHNGFLDSLNRSEFISLKPNTLNLNRVTFITSGRTASASEVLINGLKPHIPVTVVGRRSYGKPTGMYAFNSKESEWTFVIVSITIWNALNEGEYYDGIAVDIEANDGVLIPWGDTREPSLNAALMDLGVNVAKTSPAQRIVYPQMQGLRQEIGSW